MDLRIVMFISTLFLSSAESDPITRRPDVNKTSTPALTNSTTRVCSCSSTAPAASATPALPTSSPAPGLGLLTIRWTSKCEGDVNLTLYLPSKHSLPVCHDSKTDVQSLLRDVCRNKKGCEGTPSWNKGNKQREGYYITDSARETKKSCEILTIHCTVEVVRDVHGQQLQAYKVVTALLCCVLLVLLLIRFTRPTVKALQKRLSDRRQNRWIGPTQSHSVSYHRGKNAVKSNDGEKRLSYPALERLAVSDSREPSSNRNSGYNF